jgi:hypothetical protein
MAFYGCPKSGMIYDEFGRAIHQVPEHAREEFRRSAAKDGIKLLDEVEPAPASPVIQKQKPAHPALRLVPA